MFVFVETSALWNVYYQHIQYGMIGRMRPMLEILTNQNNNIIYLYNATKKTATYKKSNG